MIIHTTGLVKKGTRLTKSQILAKRGTGELKVKGTPKSLPLRTSSINSQRNLIRRRTSMKSSRRRTVMPIKRAIKKIKKRKPTIRRRIENPFRIGF